MSLKVFKINYNSEKITDKDITFYLSDDSKFLWECHLYDEYYNYDKNQNIEQFKEYYKYLDIKEGYDYGDFNNYSIDFGSDLHTSYIRITKPDDINDSFYNSRYYPDYINGFYVDYREEFSRLHEYGNENIDLDAHCEKYSINNGSGVLIRLCWEEYTKSVFIITKEQ